MASVEDFSHIIGQKLNMVRQHENEFWFVFDEDMVMVRLPDIVCNCIGCEEKKRGFSIWEKKE